MRGGALKENKSIFTPVFHLLTLNQRKCVRDCAPSHNAPPPDPQLPEGNDHSRKRGNLHKEQKQRAHFVIFSDRTEQPITEPSDHRRACSQSPNPDWSFFAAGPDDKAHGERLKISTLPPPVAGATLRAA